MKDEHVKIKNIRKGMGVAMSTWLGYIDDDDRKLAGFKVWRDFYEDDMNPIEATNIVRRG